ncbi:oligopeptide transport system permease protein oppB [Vibrio ishigakensis]|uniref:Oligopeptide transport system permease protein oppB n=1 Tax=Vibrio ishigakensis TaxID=1481914 RepID=A0A0B8NZN9_9VIBR|nr:oligopeptide transport system permease protein oppB [Vibrio ishigakensis]
MSAYIIRRLLLVIPTLWAIITINFFVIQIAPGGPVEQAIAQMQGLDSGVMERFTGGGQEVELGGGDSEPSSTGYRGSRGMDLKSSKRSKSSLVSISYARSILRNAWQLHHL